MRLSSGNMRRILVALSLGTIGLNGCAIPPDDALRLAIRNDEPDEVNAAVGRGAKINVLSEQQKDHPIFLDEHGKISPLMDAVERGKPGAVKALLANGADPNLANENGLSPLYLSLPYMYRNTRVVKMLLDAGANPNVIYRLPDRKREQTPLMRALESPQRPSEVELLLKYGARPNLITPAGHSALDVVNTPDERAEVSKNQGWKVLTRRGAKARLLNPTPTPRPPTPAEIQSQQERDAKEDMRISNMANG